MNDILEAGGTSLQTIGQVVNEQLSPLDTNIIEANSQVIMGYLDEISQKVLNVDTMQDLTKNLDEYQESLNNNIQTYVDNTREGYNTLQELLDSSTRAEVIDYLIPQISTTSEEGLNKAKEQLSLQNIKGEDMIQKVSNMSIDSQIEEMTVGTSCLLSNLIKNQSLLDQNVHIDANFPNVNNHTQIEEAFNNLVNMAAMSASGYKD